MQLPDCVDVSMSLKQGEPLSLLLFILVFNGIMGSIDLNKLDENEYSFYLSDFVCR